MIFFYGNIIVSRCGQRISSQAFCFGPMADQVLCAQTKLSKMFACSTHLVYLCCTLCPSLQRLASLTSFLTHCPVHAHARTHTHWGRQAFCMLLERRLEATQMHCLMMHENNTEDTTLWAVPTALKCDTSGFTWPEGVQIQVKTRSLNFSFSYSPHSQTTGGWMNEWMNECVNEWMNEWMNRV